MIRAIIVDDELNAIKSLSWEIGTFCSDIKVIDSFTKPEEAIFAINYLKPDCVFLDVEMPKMDGFQLLSKLKYRDFDLVITTAYDNYAVKAFKENAIDYLLKPIDSDDLIKLSYKLMKNKKKLGIELNTLLNSFVENQSAESKKIALPLKGKTIFVKLTDITYCNSEGNYTTIYLNNNEKFLLSKKIKDIEIMCNSKDMVRVHQSFLVNKNYIKEYVRSEKYYLILEDKTIIPVSKAKRNQLQEKI